MPWSAAERYGHNYEGFEELGLVDKNGNPTGQHAEARAFRYLLGESIIPPPQDALRGTRQAISSNSCVNCGKLQEMLGVTNVTGTVDGNNIKFLSRLKYLIT